MRHLPAKLYLAALCALANAQSLEPDTDGLFYAWPTTRIG
jgi:hypothetical protein